MSDFSELCPLFSTGVYKELSIYSVGLTGLSLTNNALVGALAKATYPGSLKFQRSVVVTKCFHKTDAAPATACIVVLTRHAATGTAAGTAFASLSVSTSSTLFNVNRYIAMTQASNKNFNAADVLGVNMKAKVATGGKHSFIIRYKER